MMSLQALQAPSNVVVMICDVGVVVWLLFLMRTRRRSMGEWRTPLAFAAFIFLRGLGRGMKALTLAILTRDAFAADVDAALDLITAFVGLAMAIGLLTMRRYAYRVGSSEEMAAIEDRLSHVENEIEQVALEVQTPPESRRGR